MEGPSQSWKDQRRCRKAASANIFRGVDLARLQQLFHTSGDHEAGRRARLVWDLGNGAELAQALGRLRAHSRKNRLRSAGSPYALASTWLHAFRDLRIDEGLVTSQDNDENKEKDPGREYSATCGLDREDLKTGSMAEGAAGSEPLESSRVTMLRQKAGASDQGSDRKPERYLHYILR